MNICWNNPANTPVTTAKTGLLIYVEQVKIIIPPANELVTIF